MSTVSAAWICLSPRQRTPSLPATPRGSQLTRSYRSRSRETAAAYAGIVDTPELPGPPKSNNSEPMRFFSRALVRMSASLIVSPSGFDQSSGALSVAHCQSLPGAVESAVALQRPQSSLCEARAEGRSPAEAVGPAVGWAWSGPPEPPLSVPDESPHAVISSTAAKPRAVQRAKPLIAIPPSQAFRSVPRMAFPPW
ncbi:hypothetical protein SALBM311S_06436 [Streptomyces alboniger]